MCPSSSSFTQANVASVRITKLRTLPLKNILQPHNSQHWSITKTRIFVMTIWHFVSVETAGMLTSVEVIVNCNNSCISIRDHLGIVQKYLQPTSRHPPKQRTFTLLFRFPDRITTYYQITQDQAPPTDKLTNCKNSCHPLQSFCGRDT